jgi:hypothetical protein
MDDPQIEMRKSRAKQFGEELKSTRSPAPVQLQLTALNHKSDHVTWQIEKALRSPIKEYRVSKQTNQLMHTHQFESPKNKGLGELKLIISGLPEQACEPIENALDSIGDACRDTFVAITGLYIEKHGTEMMRSAFFLSIDEILDACGKKRNHGSFEPEARAEVIKHLKTLSQTYFEFSMPSTQKVKRGRTWVEEDCMIEVKGPLLTHDGSIAAYLKITGKELWAKQSIILGPWASLICGKGSTIQTKLLPTQVLAYSPNNEPYHKRLGHYIHWLFRNNANEPKGAMKYGITMKALFEGAGIVPTRDRGRFKDDIDNALKHLKEDDVIGEYWCMEEKTKPEVLKKVIARQGRWFDSYLGLYINFSPPQVTLKHYRNMAKRDQIEKDESESEFTRF